MGGLRQLLANRWQIPLALAAVGVGAAAVWRLMPAPRPVPVETILAKVAALQAEGDFGKAADALANLLELTPALPPVQRGRLHAQLADTIFRAEQRREQHSARNAELILEHQEQARRLGALDDRDRWRVAHAQLWRGDLPAAIEQFDAAAESGLAPAERRVALQRLIELTEGQRGLEDRHEAWLAALLQDDGADAAYVWWTLRQRFQEALDRGDLVGAAQQLEQFGGRLGTSDLKGYGEYLRAWLLVEQGQPEAAAPIVQWIDQWLAEAGPATAALDRQGSLRALTQYLQGRIHLAEERPRPAVESFRAAHALQPFGDLVLHAAVGQAQALAALGEHEAALSVLAQPLQRPSADGALGTARERLRRTVRQLAQVQLDAGAPEVALLYLARAHELTPADAAGERLDLLDQLARLHARAAERATDAASQRAHHLAAGQAHEAAAQLAQADLERSANLHWAAAQQFDLAGRFAEARRILQSFVDGRARNDPRLPAALLALGQTNEALGEFDEALRWYGLCAAEFPRLTEAAQGRYRSAGCLIALGRAREPEAERLLSDLLEDDVISPSAAVYRDALLQLCDLLFDQGRFGESIGRLENFRALYPRDPQSYRSRFLLADAYRRSGLALRERALGEELLDEQRAETRGRLMEAAKQFGTYASHPPDHENPEVLALYVRLAMFYRGDCLFELNEPETLAEALATYRQAAAQYDNQPAALTAQVQIANVQLRLGRRAEAARAIERARWLLRVIPDQAFARADDGAGRPTWEEFLSRVSASALLADAFSEVTSAQAFPYRRFPHVHQ